MRICGIDPGSKGGMCVLDLNDPAYIHILDLEKVTNYEAARWLYKHQVNHIFIEDVHSMHGMSAKSNFNFGKNLGIVTTISELILQGAPIDTITPKKWQKYIGVTTKGKAIKFEVAELCLQIYPAARDKIYGPQGGLRDGCSDALMIAHYGLHHKEL